MIWGQAIDVYVASSIIGVNKIKIPPLEAASETLKALWISSFFFYTASALVKISIMLFYKRIFDTHRFRIASRIMIAVLAGWGLGINVSVLFTAWPITDAWNVKAGHFIINPTDFHISQAWTSLILDVITLCFPLPMIRTLQMPLRRKLLVSMIFGLGSFCCIAAAVRLYFLYAEIHFLLNSKSNFFLAFPKITREWIWSKIEPNASIIAACLPSYTPLFPGIKNLFESFAISVRSIFTLASRSSSTVDGPGVFGKKDYNASDREGLAPGEIIELERNAPGGWNKNAGNNEVYTLPQDLEHGMRERERAD